MSTVTANAFRPGRVKSAEKNFRDMFENTSTLGPPRTIMASLVKTNLEVKAGPGAQVREVCRNYLEAPGSHRAYEFLHTSNSPRVRKER